MCKWTCSQYCMHKSLTDISNHGRAELGRAAWKVLHTTFARFPEKPTDDEKEALRSYVHLFQRLYPWYVLSYVALFRWRLARANHNHSGECAEHFGQVLTKYPPQVSSRTAAAMWGCFVHNVVNKRLKKPEFNCEDIGDAYDCGCGDEEPKASGKDAAT
jgi:FAD-linked sulfhydryl oxidase